MERYCSFINNAGSEINECCREHDFQYSEFGTLTRAEADMDLRQCAGKRHPKRAFIGWVIVRLFGWIYWKR